MKGSSQLLGAVLVAAVVATTSGTADAQTISKSQASAAITKFLDQRAICLVSNFGTWDATTIPAAYSATSPELKRANRRDKDGFVPEGQAMLALEEAGVLKSSVQKLNASKLRDWQKPRGVVDARVFELSPAGTASLGFDIKLNKSAKPSICYGKGRLVEIVSVSTPAPLFGYVVTNVKYRYEPVATQQWVSHQAIKEAFPEIAATIGKTVERTDSLVHSSSGWSHPELR